MSIIKKQTLPIDWIENRREESFDEAMEIQHKLELAKVERSNVSAYYKGVLSSILRRPNSYTKEEILRKIEEFCTDYDNTII